MERRLWQEGNELANARSSFIPGMEEGAGDCSNSQLASSFMNDSPSSHVSQQEKDNVAALQSRLANLTLPHSVHSKVKHEVEAEVEGVDDTYEDSVEDESEIEPLCSYPYGYMKRQTVYICMTCNDPSKENWKPAGVCIGCRHACHQGHEVISLETRRNFRCDCGNKNMGCSCILWPEKEDTNEQNMYNSNYKGTFCTCKCKESDCVEEDPLYQCVICEDWFHASHANAKAEGIEKNYTDLICGECTSKLEFLRFYEPFDPNAVVDENAIDEMIKYTDIESGSEEDEQDDGKKPDSKTTEPEPCKLETLTKKDPYPTGQLWTLGWRGKLCRCSGCKEMYAKLNVSYLLDKDDETRRYFSAEGEEETQVKICTAVRKFEEWLLQMSPEEREDLFNSGPEIVKQKMKEYFESSKDADDEDFTYDDSFLDQLFEAFSEFILDAEGGVDYLFDVDELEKAMRKDKGEDGIADDDNVACQAEGESA